MKREPKQITCPNCRVVTEITDNEICQMCGEIIWYPVDENRMMRNFITFCLALGMALMIALYAVVGLIFYYGG